jgi:hypothetical protein
MAENGDNPHRVHTGTLRELREKAAELVELRRKYAQLEREQVATLREMERLRAQVADEHRRANRAGEERDEARRR